MKTMYKLLPVTLMVGLMMSFTSCDSDPWYDDYDYYDYAGNWYGDYDWYNEPFTYGTNELNQAALTLRGIWQGTLDVRYLDSNGQWVEQALDAEFRFDQDRKSVV